MRYWPHSLVLTLALSNFVVASARAESSDEVAAIKRAVKAGKITKEEAAAKLAVLKKSGATKVTKGYPAKSKQKSAYAEIEAAVKAGKLTKQEAAAKLAALKKSGAAKATKGYPAKSKQKSAYAEIEAAVKAGKITKEEAAAKLAALKKSSATKSKKGYPAKKSAGRNSDAAIAKGLAQLVKAGHISKEQAKAMLEAARKAGNKATPTP